MPNLGIKGEAKHPGAHARLAAFLAPVALPAALGAALAVLTAAFLTVFATGARLAVTLVARAALAAPDALAACGLVCESSAVGRRGEGQLSGGWPPQRAVLKRLRQRGVSIKSRTHLWRGGLFRLRRHLLGLGRR